MAEDFQLNLTNLLAILDSFQDDILITDSTGIVIEANVHAKTNLFPNFKKVSREALEATIQKMIEMYPVEKPEKLFELITKLQNSHFLKEHLKIRLQKNSRDKYYEISSSPIFQQDQGFQGRIWLFRDITTSELYKLEKSDLLAKASSQLSLPISIVLKESKELLEVEDVKIKETANKIYQASLQASTLLSDLFNISNLEKSQTINPSQFDLITLTKEIISQFDSILKSKNIKINLTSDFQQMIIISEPVRLAQAVKHLIDNAIKYSKASESIDVSISKVNNKVSVKIKDTGVGIPLKEQSKLFTKFFRASNIKSSEVQGTGIGLYFVKKAVEDLKGTIVFQSMENVGSVFQILLPETI